MSDIAWDRLAFAFVASAVLCILALALIAFRFAWFLWTDR